MTDSLHLGLFIGGPEHGTYRQVDKGANQVTILSRSETDSVITPIVYIRRELEGETHNGRFLRVIYVEQGMPPEVAQQGLQSILLQNLAAELLAQWMEGGEPIGTDTE